MFTYIWGRIFSVRTGRTRKIPFLLFGRITQVAHGYFVQWRIYQQQLEEEHLRVQRDLAEHERRLKRRSRRVKPAVKPLPATKSGRCLTCKHALRPKVWLTGRKAGRASLLCARWWKRLPGGNRACWYSVPATPDDLQLFPSGVLNLYYNLRMRLLRGGL